VLRHHLFVGGDDVTTGGEGGLDVLVGRLLAADHLDHDLDALVVEDLASVGGKQCSVDPGISLLVRIADEDAPHLERAADPLGEDGGTLAQDLGDTGADVAQTHQANADCAIAGGEAAAHGVLVGDAAGAGDACCVESEAPGVAVVSGVKFGAMLGCTVRLSLSRLLGISGSAKS
jgi:hypothetical protein